MSGICGIDRARDPTDRNPFPAKPWVETQGFVRMCLQHIVGYELEILL